MKRFIFFSILVILTTLVACGGVGIGGITDSPEGAANEWLQALAKADGLKLDERTCSSQVTALQDGTLLSSLFGPVGQAVRSDKAKVDISTVKVSQTASEGDTALVQVTGRIRAGEGLSVQSRVLEQTWQMAREDGKWRFCGLPPLTAADLSRIVLQPSEIQLPLYLSAEGVEEFSRIFANSGGLGYMIQSIQPKDAVLRVYSSPSTGTATYSAAMLFDSAQGAALALQDMKRSLTSSAPAGAVVWRELLDLGDEAYKLTSDQSSPDFYLWRSQNVVLWVFSGSGQGSQEEPSLSLAEKMQAHVSSEATPEPLPTPLATIPPPEPTVPTSAPPTAAP